MMVLNMLSRAMLITVMVVPFVFNAFATPRTFPVKSWQLKSPQSQSIDSLKLHEAMVYFASICGSRKTDHTIVIKNGYSIWQGKNIDTVFNVWSCTKSFTSTVLGLLIEDKKCSLHTNAAAIVPALQSEYPDLTLRHFVTMTSGVQSVSDDKPFTARHPLFKPGAYFHYGDDLNMFALVLTKIAKRSLYSIFKERIADPVGMDSANFFWGDFGKVDGLTINGGSGTFDKGVHCSAAQLARFGYLLLNKGNWKGKQLLSADWIEQATKSQTPPSIQPFQNTAWYTLISGAYGYNFWVNGIKSNGERLWPAAPVNTFAIQGNNNNICIVVPQWDIVLVRLGDDNVIDMDLYDGLFSRLNEAFRR